MARSKFYAVGRGREGPKVYDNWTECERAVIGWAGALHKSFATRKEAQAWITASEPGIMPANPWSTIPEPQSSPQPFFVPETPPTVPLDIEPFTADFIPLSDGPDTQGMVTQKPIVSLSNEQEQILHLVQIGKNVFFTGSAGTGKSVLLREIIDHFGGRVSEALAITASTGIAALNIGGTTLHSFAGIGLGVENIDKLLARIMGNKYSRQRWTRTRTLIIDEISMVDGALFDKLEYIARKVRGKELPFGGIQLVVSGDFCQLPPVPEQSNSRFSTSIRFAFEAESWERCFDDTKSVHRLNKVFRQRDESFIDMLNSMRKGQLDAGTSAQFYELSRPIHYGDGLEPCELFPLREQVCEANDTRLRRLPGRAYLFAAMDTGGYDIYHHLIDLERAKQLLDRLIAPDMIALKVGARVMLIKNLVQGKLVNGSLGQVVAFQSLGEARGLKTEIAEVDISEKQNKLEIRDASVDIPDHDAYVDKLWPVVRFDNGRTLLLTPVEFEMINVQGEMEARRDQIPLILAWALSIHKSQGQTLERVKVDLGRIFEKGQAYVALSRATSLTGLQVLNFHPSKVMAHPRVLEYYQRLDGKKACQAIPAARSHSQPYDEFDELDDEEAMARYYAVVL